MISSLERITTMREKRDTQALNVKIDRNIYNQLGDLCKETGIPKARVVERVLEKFLEEYNKKPKNERSIFWVEAFIVLKLIEKVSPYENEFKKSTLQIQLGVTSWIAL